MVMADIAPGRAERKLPNQNAKLLNPRHLRLVQQNLRYALLPVGLHVFLWNNTVVGDAHISNVPRVRQKRPHMILARVAVCLAVLCHDVQDIFAHRTRLCHSLADTVHQKIGDDAGIQASRADQDNVRLTDGADTVLQCLRMLRDKTHLPDAAVADFFA